MHKLDDRSQPCVFLGYSTSQSAYFCLHQPTGRIYVSRHVQFDESKFPFAAPTSPLVETEASLHTTNTSSPLLLSFSSPDVQPPQIPPPAPSSSAPPVPTVAAPSPAAREFTHVGEEEENCSHGPLINLGLNEIGPTTTNLNEAQHPKSPTGPTQAHHHTSSSTSSQTDASSSSPSPEPSPTPSMGPPRSDLHQRPRQRPHHRYYLLTLSHLLLLHLRAHCSKT